MRVEPHGSRSGPPAWAVCLGLAALVFLIYGQAASHEFVNFDDDEYVSENPWVLRGLTLDGVKWAFTTGRMGNWHPLTWLSHMLDVELFGASAGAHHLSSVFLHAINAALLFLALRALTRAPWPSAIAAALFAVHPLRVESVAWVAERKDVLSGMFWIAAMLAWAAYARRPAPGRYALVLGAMALGLMAKPMVVTLPFALLLLDVWPLGRWVPPGFRREASGAPSRSLPALALEKAPLLALAAASSVVTWIFQKEGGATSSFAALSAPVRLANAALAWTGYLWKTVWPVDLAIFYPHPSLVRPDALGAIAAPAAAAGAVLLALTVAFWRLGRERPYFLTGWLWYLGTLVPVIGIVQVGMQSMADRYTYVPAIGIGILVAWAARDFLSAKAFAVFAGVAIAALTGLAFRQAGTWKDGSTLYRHALRVTSDNFLAHNNLGVTLAKNGKHADAIPEYEAALAIVPHYAEAHNNLGIALKRAGSFAEAGRHFEEAIRSKPRFAEAHNNLGTILEARGDLSGAEAAYRRALAIRPDYANALSNLGTVLAKKGDPAGGLEMLEAAVRLQPDRAESRKNLGIVLLRMGRIEEAAAQYREAVRLMPESADLHNDLAILLDRLGHPDEARFHRDEAARLRFRSR